MAKTSIGDFLVSVGAEVNAQSFNNATKSINNLESSISKLVGFVKTSAPLIMASTAGAVETSNLKMAKAIGVSTSQLDRWKTAAGIAGVSASALTSSMASLENKMQKFKVGEVDTGLAKNLGFLGIQYQDFANMDQDQRMRSVFAQAGKMSDQQRAAQLVGDTLGSGAREYYDYLKLSGKTLDQELNEAKLLNFTTEETKKNAMAFNSEAKAIGGAFKSIAMLIGSDIAKELTPLAKRMKEVVEANHDVIVSGIHGFIETLGRGLNNVVGILGKVGPFVEKLIAGFGGLDKVIVKVGVGFAALKIGGIAMNIRSLVSGIGLLKVAMNGLKLGAWYLILEDLFVFAIGGNSVFGDIVKKFKELKEEGKFDNLIASFDKLKNALTGIVDALGGKDAIVGALGDIGGAILEFGTDALVMAVNLLKDLADLLKNLITGDWKGAGKNLKDFFADMGSGLSNMLGLDDPETVKKINTGARSIPLYKWLVLGTDWGMNKLGLESDEEYAKNKAIVTGKAQDGIWRPDGSLLQVSPNDWVLAAKDLDDMASAFIPRGGMNNSNNVNAPANYIVNQNITVNGGNSTAQAVRQQAYDGAKQGIGQMLNQGQRRYQQMTGTK